jgi:hypothetical protein
MFLKKPRPRCTAVLELLRRRNTYNLDYKIIIISVINKKKLKKKNKIKKKKHSIKKIKK